MTTNYLTLYEGLKLFRDHLLPFIVAKLQTAYGDRMAFIHNEVYVDNDPAKGLRPQLRAFGLTSEPWLFVIDARGRVAARLEGAFGIDEFRAAIERGLRGAPAS